MSTLDLDLPERMTMEGGTARIWRYPSPDLPEGAVAGYKVERPNFADNSHHLGVLYAYSDGTWRVLNRDEVSSAAQDTAEAAVQLLLIPEPKPEPAPARSAWYPNRPPTLEGEGPGEYMARLSDPETTPYDHIRWPTCRAGMHAACPFDTELMGVAKLLGELVDDPCECPCHIDQTMTLLGNAIDVLGSVDRVAMRYEHGLWRVQIEQDGREHTGEGSTPNAAWLAVYDELGWSE